MIMSKPRVAWQLALALSATLATAAVEVPEGYTCEVLADKLNAMTSMAIAPDGRVFLADQTGPLRVVKDGRLLPKPALDLTGRLDEYWERGLIGLAFHPDFPVTPFLYTLYVAKQPHTHHVVSRFTVIGDTVDAASEQILLEGDDQAKMGGKQPGGHQGGPLRFGPDGKLYIGLGEQTAGEAAQKLDTLLGKILRINADGSIPQDNPFYEKTTGKYRTIWAYGIRNPYGMVFEPGTGRLFETEVGQTSFEEINLIERGANYGWPLAEGPTDNPAFKSPIHSYPPVVGRSIVGAAFGEGKLFFADWAANWLKTLDPAQPSEATIFAKGLEGPVALEFAPDGSLLVLNRATIWRDGKKCLTDSGSLLRIFKGGPGGPKAEPLPANFAWPAEGYTELKLAHAPWNPGVTTQRWKNAEGVVVQRHAVAKTGHVFETHVLWPTRAAAYHADGSLIADAAVIDLPGDPDHRWFSPGPERSFNPETTVVGFQPPSATEGLVALDDANAPLELRARSYLHVNCAQCHHPGGPSRGAFDARISTPLAQQGLINGAPIAGDLGIAGAKIIAPGAPEKSILLERLKRHDAAKMPPTALNSDPSPVLGPLREWIESLQ
jgi:glucose/arabinose dehydrogenase